MPDLGRHVTLALVLTGGCSTFDWEGSETNELASYRNAFVRAAGDRLHEPLAREQVVQRIATSRILWLGDQHRSSRLHALQSELLEDLSHAGVQLVFALEAIGEQDEPLVRQYLSGKMSMEELRTAVRRRWRGSWLDDRDLDPWFYRSLLTFARRTGTPVLALEPTPRRPLAERDEAMARAVRGAVERHRDRVVVVVVGQAHLLGEGALIARCGDDTFAVGGEPVPALREAPPPARGRGTLWRGDAGLWWFEELLRSGD